MPYEHILFPGRHHLLTRFQAAYLERAVAVGAPDAAGAHADCRGAQVVFAVTSADHGTTRRNPLPAHRREAQIERYAALSGMDCLVFPIADVPATERFAEYLLAAIAVQEGPELTPENTVLACSTPEVIALFEAIGFRILRVELGRDELRPWDVLEALVAGVPTRAMHPASVQLWERYDLLAQVRRAHADPLLTDEGELTETRDYNTYARAFDTGAARKWEKLRAVTRPGRVVDVGCGVGSLLHEIAADPAFAESDLYGIEAARPLFDECVHRRGQGAFANPNTFFFQRTIGQGPLFASASVDTTLTVALCHELYSYLGEETLTSFMAAVREHTVPGGVWIDLDVCGPEDGDRLIWMELHDGRESWERFVADWIPERIEYELHDERYVETRLRWAMEWLSKKDYTDNWESEMHESFCFWSYGDWERAARSAGFDIAPGSHGFTNPWLVEHRFAPVATLRPAGERDRALPWPDTHLRLVARRPVA
jgi:SAM-dependent methyltransferase